ncbi:MAG: hypothetical protein ACLRIL_08295 [Fusicatenibacter saccharivorans]
MSYFCQSFREYFGISPQKYRDQGSKMTSFAARIKKHFQI